jgi:hypothetical protein
MLGDKCGRSACIGTQHTIVVHLPPATANCGGRRRIARCCFPLSIANTIFTLCWGVGIAMNRGHADTSQEHIANGERQASTARRQARQRLTTISRQPEAFSNRERCGPRDVQSRTCCIVLFHKVAPSSAIRSLITLFIYVFLFSLLLFIKFLCMMTSYSE